MTASLTMIHGKGEKLWLGKILEPPEIDETLAKHILRFPGLLSE